LGVWASDAEGTYRFAILYFAIAIVVPLLYVVWLLKSGRISDFHMPHRGERVGPFVASLVCSLVGIGLLIYLGSPRMFLVGILAAFAQTLVLCVITLAWQISVHTSTAAGLATFAVLALGPPAAVLGVIVPIVGWARLALRRHTVAQVVAGAGIGCLCFCAMFALRGIVW
jgi:membrane-associated phospholipid phosphatase